MQELGILTKKKGQAKKALAKTDLASRDYQKQGLLSSLEIAGRNQCHRPQKRLDI